MNRARATWLDSVMTSPGVTSVMGAIALCASVIAADTDIPSAAMWTGVTAALLLLNKAFYFTQNPSPVIAGLFLMLQAAMPAYSSGENMDGALLALAAIAGLAALCSCFSAPQKTRTLFIPLLIAGAGAVFSFAYLLLGAVFLAGIIQVRSFSPRGLLAACLGMVTGPAILYGFGIVPWRLPYMPDLTLPDITALHTGMSLLASALVCVAFGGACMLVAYGYPAKARACNALVYSLTLCAMALAAIDFNNVSEYLVLLNCCAAFHISHFAATHTRGWIAIAITIAGCAALFIWNSCT